MKHLKMLVLALVAVVAAMALAGAGSASATVLCKTQTNPCASLYGKGTVIRPTLTGSNSLETLGGTTLTTCTGTSIKTLIENPGSATTTVSGPNTELVASGCTNETVTIKSGSLEIHSISGTANGTVTGLVAEVQVNTGFFGKCTYGAGSGTDIGTLVGGASPVIKVNGIVKKTGGEALCPSETRWTGEYKVTEPTPLYVESS
jgi:hypothetical protein